MYIRSYAVAEEAIKSTDWAIQIITTHVYGKLHAYVEEQ